METHSRSKSDRFVIKKSMTETENVEVLPFIEKEINMGFSLHGTFEIQDGIVTSNSCQRITHCSCNCNKCAAWPPY